MLPRAMALLALEYNTPLLVSGNSKDVKYQHEFFVVATREFCMYSYMYEAQIKAYI